MPLLEEDLFGYGSLDEDTYYVELIRDLSSLRWNDLGVLDIKSDF